MTKKERYLKWKHELLDSCGQCIGFRAKGIDLSNNEGSTACSPGVSCHTNCPALGTGSPAKENKPAAAKKAGTSCFRCGQDGERKALLPFRHRGESLWVCTGCLPSLIHG
ncbi:MAG: hypothetical protein ACOY30_15765 [Bacillota bacterium]